MKCNRCNRFRGFLKFPRTYEGIKILKNLKTGLKRLQRLHIPQKWGN
jgi:hypothetical protein